MSNVCGRHAGVRHDARGSPFAGRCGKRQRDAGPGLDRQDDGKQEDEQATHRDARVALNPQTAPAAVGSPTARRHAAAHRLIAPPMSSAQLFCLGLLLSASTAAAAETFAFDISTGKFDEHCLKIDAGKAIRYRFVATEPVDFNIHHHRGKEVLYPVRRDAIDGDDGEFRAPGADDYCLMWINKGGAPVRVTGEVGR
jgi:hypothetical protein